MIKLLGILTVLGIILSPVFIIFKLISGRVKKQKQMAFKGKLVDKKHLEYEDDDSAYTKDLYTLVFQTEDKKEIKLHVPEKIYNSWKVGDRAEKKPGEVFPQKK